MRIKDRAKYNEYVTKYFADEEFLEFMTLVMMAHDQAKSLYDESGKPYIKDRLSFLMADLEDKELSLRGIKNY